VRKIEQDELESLPKNIQVWTSGFVELPATKKVISSDAFNPAGCFVADEDGAVVGYVAVTNLPRKNWMTIRYLSAKQAMSRVDTLEKLLSRALEYVETKKPEFLRVTTPAVQPYVDVYKSFGFKPVRRDFRIGWDLRRAKYSPRSEIDILEVTDKTAQEVDSIFVESQRPYWEWRIEERGGVEAAARSFRDGLKQGERWLSGYVGKTVVGFTGLIPDYYEAGEARFRGAFVLPNHRGKGYGRTLMNEAMEWAKKLGQNKMTAYTFSYLDCLAPGALLYIKCGGKIDGEYLQLQRAS
jgi:GNAT superfamily N-acetyltransferase